MAVSTRAFFLVPEATYGDGAGNLLQAYGSRQAPEGSPAWLWGQGTPGAFPPFTTVNKGSLYSEVNAADDVAANLWMKLDEGGDAADWVRMGDTGTVWVRSELFDISASDSEQVIFHAVTACEVLEAGLLWEEGSAASGLEGGDITIGTASGGAQIVAATAYTVSQASGAYVALTIAEGTLAAGTSVFASHDIASGAAGTCRVVMKVRIEG